MYDKPAVFILVGRGGGEDYVPSRNVESETAIKIVGRRVQKGSTIYTDSFKSYLGLSETGYRHEYVKHSEGEWVRGECHINNWENRASILRPWLSKHRGIPKDRLETYLKIFKDHRKTNKQTTKRAHKPHIKETTTHNIITMSETRITAH